MLEDKNQSRTSLSELGEFGLINHITKHFGLGQKTTVKGVGDDAAVLDRIEAGLQLDQAQSCDDLEAYLKDLLRQQIKANMNGQYGHFEDVAMPAIPMEEGTSGNFSSPAVGTDTGSTSIELPENYTGTNNQEVAVDEADIVKTDGEYIYILRQNTLPDPGVDN